jgi:hypothetical protein
MDSIRVPLTVTIESRDSTLTKDSLTKNLFFESGPSGEPSLVKRPGLIAKTSALGAGNGIFFHKGIVWSFIKNATAYGHYLIAGTSRILTSTRDAAFSYSMGIITIETQDGFLQSDQTAPRIPIAYNGTYFFASKNVGGSITMYRTLDGLTWTNPVSVTYSGWGTRHATLGNITTTPLDGNYQYTLDQGVTWANSYSTMGTSIAANTTRFTTGAYYSSTMSGWTACTNGGAYSNIIWAGTFFIGFSVAGYAKSTDGITWTTGALIGFPVSLTVIDLVYNGTTILAWSGDHHIATSTDGITWVDRGFVTTGLTTENFTYNRVVSLSGTFIHTAIKTIDSSAYVYKSVNGITWTETKLDVGTTTVTSGVV